MLPVSDRWLESLRLARWRPSVEWSPDRGLTWHPVTLIDGTATAKSTSQVRWDHNLTLEGAPLTRDGLTPYGARIRLFQTLVYSGQDVETVPLGVCRVEDVSMSGHGHNRFTVSASGLEAQIMDERFTMPRKLQPGAASFWVQTLIQEVLPEVSLSWRLPDSTLPEMLEERDRWGLIDGRSQDPSIAKSLGGRVFADGRGQFVGAPVPSLDDPAVWSVGTGPNGVLVEPARKLERKGVYNQVVATGIVDNGQPPIGPAIVSDDDPVSPTYYKGAFGAVPLFYSSKLLTSVPACQAAARGLLATKLGLKQTVEASTVPNFALEPDDVIEIQMPEGGMEKHVIDTITYPLTGGAMRLSTRSTQTRQIGHVTEDRDADYGEGRIE